MISTTDKTSAWKIARRKLPLDNSANQVIKRIVDVIGAVIGLIVFSPIMLISGMLVFLENPGPVIYRQRRLGRYSEPFYVYKIRSIRIEHEMEHRITEDEPRFLRVGVFIRTWNIDDLPQFWNVLKGNMSLVGPWPQITDLNKLFKMEIPQHEDIRPGITGWAQVNGLRGDFNFGQRVQYDLYYLTHWSLWLDLRIIARTFFPRRPLADPNLAASNQRTFF